MNQPTRRAAIVGLVSAMTLSGCGSESGTNTSVAAVSMISGPTPTPTPTPSPTADPPKPAISVLAVGMSIFLGADLEPPDYPGLAAFEAERTPSRYFVRSLASARQPVDGAVSEYNAAVGGSFDHEVQTQYASAPGKPYNIVLLGIGMNSGSAYGVHGLGPNAAFTKERLRTFLQDLKAANSLPILCNTIHPWPEKVTAASVRSDLQDGIAWPPDQQTLLYGGDLVFDLEASRFGAITSDGDGLFERPGGGRLIGPGSRLLIKSGGGRNSGMVLTVTRRVSATTVEVQPNVMQESGTFNGYVQHYLPPIDDILVPPPSEAVKRQDWTGSGVQVDGVVSYAIWNAMLDDLCKEEGIMLIDMEYRGFKYAERYGWSSIYQSINNGVTFETFNHPQNTAQRIIYGDAMTHLGQKMSNGMITAGYFRERGPAIA